MNLTLTTPRKPTKPTFIRLTSLTPAEPISSQHTSHNSRKRRDDCSSMLLVSCLNANTSEATQNSEMCEDYLIRQLPEREPQQHEERKHKIEVSLSLKTTQRQPTPRIQAISNKTACQTSPIRLKIQNEENVSRLKITGNSTFSSSQYKHSKAAALMCSCKQSLLVQQIEKANKQANNSFLTNYQQQQLTWININNQKDQFNQCAFKFAENKLPYRNPQNISSNYGEEKYSIIQKSEHQIEDTLQKAINFKEKLKDRKWIGDYAKTIKTFNASEQKENESQIQSIVLQRGHHFSKNLPKVTPINRGSIKDYRTEEETLKRAYGSVGQELHKAHLDPRFNRYIDQAIEEDIHDSDI